jgi:hypothetical protein
LFKTLEALDLALCGGCRSCHVSQNRWAENAGQLRYSSPFILEDSLPIAGAVTCPGALLAPIETHILRYGHYFGKKPFKSSPTFTIAQSLGNDGSFEIGSERDCRMMYISLRMHYYQKVSNPLLIDPRLSGMKWLRAIGVDRLITLEFASTSVFIVIVSF